MIKKINGSSYKNMIHYGINHLDKNCAVVNDLNVFPVPDGDTGTNMVMTMRNGYHSISENTEALSGIARSFANATVFGARGNSGVIVSQFFKGISESLKDEDDADCAALARALDTGCEYAYAAVANPVEGTILTVIKDATNAIKSNLENIQSIDELIAVFLDAARSSLENTPNLLPILAKAGVVDSGGSGIVYFFEGMQRYLNGEELETVEAAIPTHQVDYSAFNRHSDFGFGYCTEVLLQLTIEPSTLDYSSFVATLNSFGDSVVSSLEGDKIKLHVHSKNPEKVLGFCHMFGEFLSLKIENMSVQHTQTTQKILCSKQQSEADFAVVAVAPNAMLQAMLVDMGADAVIMSEEVPSSQDFIEAFERISTKDIIVFPNSSNSILSAMQAGSLYKKARITVLNCRSVAQCYSALPMIDYDTDVNSAVSDINDIIGNIYEVAIVHAAKNIKYGSRNIVKNDYFALSGDEILFSANKIESVVSLTVEEVTKKRDCSVLNLFYGKNISKEQAEKLIAHIESKQPDLELCTIPTDNAIYDLVLSFE